MKKIVFRICTLFLLGTVHAVTVLASGNGYAHSLVIPLWQDQDSVQQSAGAQQAPAKQQTQPAQDTQSGIPPLSILQGFSSEEEKEEYRQKYPPAYVIFEEDTLFAINDNLGPFNPAERAIGVADRIEEILEAGPVDFEKFDMLCEDLFCSIKYDGVVITTVTSREAELLDMDLDMLAQEHYDTLKELFEREKDRSWIAILKRMGIFLIALVLFLLGFRYLNRGLKWIVNKVFQKVKVFAVPVKFNNYEFLSEKRVEGLILFGLNVIKNAGVLTLIYFYSLLLFSIFPRTEPIALKLFNYVLSPVERFAMAFISFIPKLVTIVVIIIAARYLNRFLKFLSVEIEQEQLVIPGFYPDWALPTYRLLNILINLFSFVIIFPYLPGSDSAAFQGVSVFLGLLLSLGSTSAISNIIAGLVIIYMRAFRIGDRVKIGDTVGDVVEKTMLITRIRTPKNEEVTIPNAAILNGSTVNYTSGAVQTGLIVHSTVTIGYDVPWKDVHQMLVDAALRTEHIKSKPVPFVLQTSLDDFFISYQINGYTTEASKQAGIYSDLHANIQDVFNESGVEILSPHYRAERDGNPTTIPPPHTPK